MIVLSINWYRKRNTWSSNSFEHSFLYFQGGNKDGKTVQKRTTIRAKRKRVKGNAKRSRRNNNTTI